MNCEYRDEECRRCRGNRLERSVAHVAPAANDIICGVDFEFPRLLLASTTLQPPANVTAFDPQTILRAVFDASANL
jgi:hypothetical protein